MTLYYHCAVCKFIVSSRYYQVADKHTSEKGELYICSLCLRMVGQLGAYNDWWNHLSKLRAINKKFWRRGKRLCSVCGSHFADIGVDSLYKLRGYTNLIWICFDCKKISLDALLRDWHLHIETVRRIRDIYKLTGIMKGKMKPIG